MSKLIHTCFSVRCCIYDQTMVECSAQLALIFTLCQKAGAVGFVLNECYFFLLPYSQEVTTAGSFARLIWQIFTPLSDKTPTGYENPILWKWTSTISIWIHFNRIILKTHHASTKGLGLSVRPGYLITAWSIFILIFSQKYEIWILELQRKRFSSN